MLILKDNGGALTAKSNQLDEDKYAGFVRSVNNGQVRQALDYAVFLFTELNNEIFYLREKLESTEISEKETPPKPAKAVKKTRKKASPKVEESSVEG